MPGSDIFRITLLNKDYHKYFESEVPADNPDKVKALLILAKNKGLNLKKPKDDDFNWI